MTARGRGLGRGSFPRAAFLIPREMKKTHIVSMVVSSSLFFIDNPGFLANTGPVAACPNRKRDDPTFSHKARMNL